MYLPSVDIIIPVWNRPVEARQCIASIIDTTTDARLILIDTGSERETETFLEEVTESLDERALLLSSQRNLGFVAALNQGLARSEAPYAVIVRQSSVVTPGWLEQLLALADDRPEAGLIVPRFDTDGVKKAPPVVGEADHGSFAAMLVRRSVFETIGGFDADLDGGECCLREYSRRAMKAGFLTCRASSFVRPGAEPQFGSLERRNEHLVRCRERVAAQYGVVRNYCLLMPSAATPEECDALFRLLLQPARRGDRLVVLVPRRLSRLVKQAGYALLHDNIRLQFLPMVGEVKAVRRTFQRLAEELPGIVAVTPAGAITAFGMAGVLTLAEFERTMAADATEVESFETG